MTVAQRHNINITGEGEKTILFAHGYGCDQAIWRLIVPAFQDNYSTERRMYEREIPASRNLLQTTLSSIGDGVVGSGVRGRARQKLNALLASKLATARGWRLKEIFSFFWKYKSVSWAAVFLDCWCL
ncbi:MAG TPA: hypothetical protein VGL72_12745 [Bryobacteraceae bacterium]|jgi:hypothetical protein